MEVCYGRDCEFWNDSTYIDVFTRRHIPYCKLAREQLRLDYKKRVVFASTKCRPLLRVIKFRNGDVIGASSWNQYR